MEEVMKLLQEALGGVASGRTVITAGSREELLEKVTAALLAEEADQELSAEEEAIAQVVEGMNPKLAAEFATAGLLSATREFDKGHYKCASYKMNASAVWLALSEHLLSIEKWEQEQADRREGQALRSQMFGEGWGDIRTPEEKAKQESDTASSGNDGAPVL